MQEPLTNKIKTIKII